MKKARCLLSLLLCALLVCFPGAAQETPSKPCTVEEAAALALSLAAEENLPLSEACRRAAAQTGLPRNRIYKAASAQHEASRP